MELFRDELTIKSLLLLLLLLLFGTFLLQQDGVTLLDVIICALRESQSTIWYLILIPRGMTP